MLSASLLFTLARRNLWRRPRRTVVVLFALVLGVWSMVTLAALARGSMEQQFIRAIENLAGHIQIHAPNYHNDPVIEHRFLQSPELAGVLQKPLVTAWGARVRVPAVISSERESAGVTLVGIDPAQERDLSFIAHAVSEGRQLKSSDDTGLLLGRKLAERLETRLGWRVVLTSQDVNNAIAERGFRVTGIFDANPKAMETGYVFVGRREAQEMLKLGDSISELALTTSDRNKLDALVSRLRQAVPELDVQPWTSIEPFLVLSEKVTNVFLFIWFGVVFATMSFGLVNTLLMAVFERTREFGIFQALGMPPRFILGQVLMESVILLLVGLVLGNLFAWVTIESLESGIDLSAFAEGFELIGVAPMIIPVLSAKDFLAANLLVVVLGIVASLYPAWRASRYVPVEAITRT